MSITTCEDLDWRQALGMHLWFVCGPVKSIGHVLGEYMESYEVREREGGERKQ